MPEYFRCFETILLPDILYMCIADLFNRGPNLGLEIHSKTATYIHSRLIYLSAVIDKLSTKSQIADAELIPLGAQ